MNVVELVAKVVAETAALLVVEFVDPFDSDDLGSFEEIWQGMQGE